MLQTKTMTKYITTNQQMSIKSCHFTQQDMMSDIESAKPHSNTALTDSHLS